MPYPNFAGKHAAEALITPERSAAHFVGDPSPVPERIVLCFDDALLEHVTETYAVTEREQPWGDCYALAETRGAVGVVGGFGLGTSTIAMVVEALRLRGTETFVVVGHAGSLQSDLGVGDFVVVSRALRDEGVSHHYREPGKFVSASPAVRDHLVSALATAAPRRVGSTWTIDAPYRETIPEVRQYRTEGVLTVDMEAAAVFAVARHRGATAGALFTISDLLDPGGWEPAFDQKDPFLRDAFAHAVDALDGFPAGEREP